MTISTFCLDCWVTGVGADRQHQLHLASCLWLGDVCQRDTVASEHCPVCCAVVEVLSESTLSALAFSGETLSPLMEKIASTICDCQLNQICNPVFLSSL